MGEIVTMGGRNGHLIKIVKDVKRGYKYLGLYSKPIKSEGKTMTEQEVVKPDEETSEEPKETSNEAEPKEESELEEGNK